MKHINGFPVPRWWVVLNWRLGFGRFANFLYRVRFGRYAPGACDLMVSTPIHGLSAACYADWGGEAVADTRWWPARWMDRNETWRR